MGAMRPDPCDPGAELGHLLRGSFARHERLIRIVQQPLRPLAGSPHPLEGILESGARHESRQFRTKLCLELPKIITTGFLLPRFLLRMAGTEGPGRVGDRSYRRA